MRPQDIRIGQIWTITERSRPGRNVRDRIRTIEVLDVERKQIGAFAKVRDPDTERVSWLRCCRLAERWDLIEPPIVRSARDQRHGHHPST